jgi:hypothetical protein
MTSIMKVFKTLKYGAALAGNTDDGSNSAAMELFWTFEKSASPQLLESFYSEFLDGAASVKDVPYGSTVKRALIGEIYSRAANSVDLFNHIMRNASLEARAQMLSVFLSPITSQNYRESEVSQKQRLATGSQFKSLSDSFQELLAKDVSWNDVYSVLVTLDPVVAFDFDQSYSHGLPAETRAELRPIREKILLQMLKNPQVTYAGRKLAAYLDLTTVTDNTRTLENAVGSLNTTIERDLRNGTSKEQEEIVREIVTAVSTHASFPVLRSFSTRFEKGLEGQAQKAKYKKLITTMNETVREAECKAGIGLRGFNFTL